MTTMGTNETFMVVPSDEVICTLNSTVIFECRVPNRTPPIIYVVWFRNNRPLDISGPDYNIHHNLTLSHSCKTDYNGSKIKCGNDETNSGPTILYIQGMVLYSSGDKRIINYYSSSGLIYYIYADQA